MADVYSKEVIHGPPGRPSVLRFRYVDEQGGLASREEIFDLGSVADVVDCSPDCHPHPVGPCPPSCSGPNVCFHCTYARNICSKPPPDCPQCLACALCTHFACGALCAVTCEAICNSFTEKYCCDEFEAVCCAPDLGTLYPPPIPDCL